MFKKVTRIVPVLFGMAVMTASNASAALDWTGITLDTTDVDSVMALIIVGLATLWGFRKVIKTMNRS